jgi:hypothetical protein
MVQAWALVLPSMKAWPCTVQHGQGYQNWLPGPPLKGPATLLVIQPP